MREWPNSSDVSHDRDDMKIEDNLQNAYLELPDRKFILCHM